MRIILRAQGSILIVVQKMLGFKSSILGIKFSYPAKIYFIRPIYYFFNLIPIRAEELRIQTEIVVDSAFRDKQIQLSNHFCRDSDIYLGLTIYNDVFPR